MRVLIVNSHTPFASGGHLQIMEGLRQALTACGHRVDVLLLSQNRFGHTLLGYVAAWLTDVQFGFDGPPDVVISLRFPCFVVRHPHHVVWLCHRMREYDDLWDVYARQWPPLHRGKERLRRWLIRRWDRWALGRVQARWAISHEVARRLQQALGLSARVLHPPPPPRPYRCDRYGPFVLWISRMVDHKRPQLAVEAIAHCESGLQLWMVGEGPALEGVQRKVQEWGLDDRVRLLGRVAESELLRLYGTCRGVLFTPLWEDYGFVTVEAFASGKPVIVCSDGGGATELVRHGHNGFVVSPDPRRLARYLDRWGHDVRVAERQGARAWETVATMRWEAVVDALLAVQ